MSNFQKWWNDTGSAIVPLRIHDHEEHAKRVAQAAWVAAGEQLQKERDEARREVCEFEADGSDCAKELSLIRGWDCFKDFK